MLIYRILLTLAAPFVALRLLIAGGGRTLGERLGTGGGPVRKGLVIWLHGASNGELTAAGPLIDAVLKQDPALSLLITSNSETARDMVRGWGLDRVTARLAPLDYRLIVNRFLGTWQPDLLILVENEMWPNRMLAMQRLDRPVVVVSARMSARSAATWHRLPGLARRVMAAICHLSAQDSASEARFVALGLPEARLGPVLNLKSARGAGTVDAREKARLARVFARNETVLAASTHEGEEDAVLHGFAQAQAKRPSLKLILAPRHPRRSTDVQALIARYRLGYATRSAGETPNADTAVYLADTLGEMPLWYDLAAVTFIGGSLVPCGGHTPFEPAAQQSAVLHGPHLDNFADIYAALDAAGAATRIDGADDLTRVLLTLDASARAAMTESADRVVGDLQRSAGLAPLLQKLSDLTGDAALRPKKTED